MYVEKITSSIDDLSKKIIDAEPKPINAFVRSNDEEQKALFLSGQIDQPDNQYNNLAEVDIDELEKELESYRSEIPNTDVRRKFIDVYEAQIDRYLGICELMRAARDYKQSGDPDAAARFMERNIELYGEPDRDIYMGLVAEAKQAINEKDLDKRGQKLREELLSMLPKTDASTERFKPSAETVQWIQGAATVLYGDMLSHVPERDEKFNPEEVAEVFREIIDEEFGETANGWEVKVTEAASINVVAGEKLIKIPENRKPMSSDELRRLVVHELGVHMMRAVAGSETDLGAMSIGLSGYYDSEEGFGVVMEQALDGKFRDAGVPYYLIAGLEYFDHKDFRETFEVMWRHDVLMSTKNGESITDEQVEKSKQLMYAKVMRINRGTDDLPWFKDLAYYNGNMSMWQHIEDICGDDFQLAEMFLGKADMTKPDHERTAYETKVPVDIVGDDDYTWRVH